MSKELTITERVEKASEEIKAICAKYDVSLQSKMHTFTQVIANVAPTPEPLENVTST